SDALHSVAQESTNIAITDKAMKSIGAGLAIGLGSFGPALAIGNLVGHAMDALGRNPEAQPVIQTDMILGLAFAEAIAIYALVIGFMIGFVFWVSEEAALMQAELLDIRALGFNLPAPITQLINFLLPLLIVRTLLYKPPSPLLQPRNT